MSHHKCFGPVDAETCDAVPVNMSATTRTDSISVNALILMSAIALRRFSVLSST